MLYTSGYLMHNADLIHIFLKPKPLIYQKVVLNMSDTASEPPPNISSKLQEFTAEINFKMSMCVHVFATLQEQ